jgi:hypothetical protein
VRAVVHQQHDQGGFPRALVGPQTKAPVGLAAGMAARMDELRPAQDPERGRGLLVGRSPEQLERARLVVARGVA